jgi:ferredoxin-NADP reductase
MKVKFTHLDKKSPNLVSLNFEKSEDFEYLAGQYVEVSFPDETDAMSEGNRWFTLSSSPTEKKLTITTRLNAPLSKFKQRFISLKKGDEIVISEPIGDFVLPRDKSIPLFFISGGIGMTPVRSIVKYLSDLNESRQITLDFFIKDKSDAIFSDIFNGYTMNYFEFVTTSNNPTVKDLRPKLNIIDKNTLFFISGPQLMVESMTNGISQKFDRQQIVMDYFPGYPTI